MLHVFVPVGPKRKYIEKKSSHCYARQLCDRKHIPIFCFYPPRNPSDRIVSSNLGGTLQS